MKAAGLHRICVQASERKRVKNIADAICAAAALASGMVGKNENE